MSVFYFKGSETISTSIWHSWSDANLAELNPKFNKVEPPYALAALNLTLKDGLYWYSGKFIRLFNYGLYGR